MNIVLPDDLLPVIQRRAEARGFESPEAYVAALIDADRKQSLTWDDLTETERREVQRIGDLLEKSLDSGPPIVADEAYWEAKKRRLRERRVQGA